MSDFNNHRTYGSAFPGPHHRVYGTAGGPIRDPGVRPGMGNIFKRVRPEQGHCPHCYLPCGCRRFKVPR
jgi:hypothetical protein